MESEFEKLAYRVKAEGGLYIAFSEGQCAVMHRHEDGDGVTLPRYSPDPCDFKPIEYWLGQKDLKKSAI